MAFVAMGIAAAASVYFALDGRHELAALRVQQQELQQRAEAPPSTPKPRVQPVMPYDASARAALVQAQAGWGPLLASLESMEVVGVTAASIDVSSSDRQVRVDLEYSDLATLLRFVDEINGGEPSPKWRLVQAQGPSRSTTLSAASSVATIVGAW